MLVKPSQLKRPQVKPDAPAPPPRKPRLGPAFWAGILFGLVCIFLGAVVGIWGSRIFPPPLPPPPAVLPAEPPPASRASPNSPAERPTTEAFDPASDTYALEQRLAQVEAESRERTEAANAALAIAAIAQAAERGTPFVAEVEAHRAALPSAGDAQALAELAAVGAPTRATLLARFPDAAALAAAAARQARPAPNMFQRIGQLLSRVVSVRRTDRLTGPDPDAVLARAEAALGRGDLAGALREAAALPPPAAAAFAPWRTDAERRLAIEARLAALRAAALARLNAGVAAAGVG